MRRKLKNDSELLSKYRALKINGKRKDVHRYIMETILGRELESNEVVHHKDGNKLNNNPDNLMLMTKSEHARLHMTLLSNFNLRTKEERSDDLHKAWESGAYEHLKKPVASFDKNTGELIKIYESAKIAELEGHSPEHIADCCSGKRKTHHGLIWKYFYNCPELQDYQFNRKETK